jgi:GTP pyrophosphokinase
MPSLADKNETSEILSHLDRAQVNLLSYIKTETPEINRELIGKAVKFSILAHKNQYRRAGLPYVEHPFEVAKILVDFKMDATTISAALLHDVVEDTGVTVEDIHKEFGEEVAFLVDAVTKISALQMRSRAERQAETFRKMLISMAKDFRVIIIKFADRLHNMRTLGYMREEKKRAVSEETLEVYAPLAHRFGLAKVRWELEDLAFKNLNPNAYKNLVDNIVEKREERETYIRALVEPVRKCLSDAGIKARVFGRPKHFYSIHKKIQSRKCRFEDVYDLFAIRIIVNNVADCYSVLGLVHDLWPPLQTRFKDYIATSKSNMYQSLHTTLIGLEGKPVEVQIRTGEMDLTAEYGIAAHWAYKEDKSPEKQAKESKWLSQMMGWQKDLSDSAQFMDFLRIDLKLEEIFVFTPNGDLIQLPKGATALDFAFAVHSEVGTHCVGAKVDGKIVSLDKVLRTGSTVEILKAKAQHPSSDWMRIVVTAKAKNNIRRWLKNEEQEKRIQLGRELLLRELKTIKAPEEALLDLKPYAVKYTVESWETLYKKIGNGEITLGSLSAFLKKTYAQPTMGVLDRVRFKKPMEKTAAVLVSGMDNMLVRFANCCQPLPGDKITGYVTKGRGVSIHRAKCPEGTKLSKEKDRVVPVIWDEDIERDFDVFIEVTGRDKQGLLNEITQVLIYDGINIERASIITVRGQVRNRFKIRIKNLEQLDRVFTRLRKIKGIRSVIRKQPGKNNEDEKFE